MVYTVRKIDQDFIIYSNGVISPYYYHFSSFFSVITVTCISSRIDSLRQTVPYIIRLNKFFCNYCFFCCVTSTWNAQAHLTYTFNCTGQKNNYYFTSYHPTKTVCGLLLSVCCDLCRAHNEARACSYSVSQYLRQQNSVSSYWQNYTG